MSEQEFDRNAYRTPQSVFSFLWAHYYIEPDFDLAATGFNKVAGRNNYFTKYDNALTKSWAGLRKTYLWLNPPYKDKEYPLKDWIRKCREEADLGANIIVLVPLATISNLYYVDNAADHICVLGRVNFLKPDGSPTVGAMHDSVLLFYGPEAKTHFTRNKIVFKQKDIKEFA
jgi:phage N-6-adenine-methyltransferase